MNEEQNLISRAQRGDVQAYELLVRQYEQIAYRAAYLITREEFEAAEAAQDAFLRAWRALGSFKLGLPFRPWLLRIVTNLALNRVTSRDRRERAVERYRHEAVVSQDEQAVDNLIELKEQNQQLLDAVRRLSPDDQVLISLRYFLELPEADVAETLNIPLGTVKSRLYRTLGRLRELIRREYPDMANTVS